MWHYNKRSVNPVIGLLLQGGERGHGSKKKKFMEIMIEKFLNLAEKLKLQIQEDE